MQNIVNLKLSLRRNGSRVALPHRDHGDYAVMSPVSLRTHMAPAQNAPMSGQTSPAPPTRRSTEQDIDGGVDTHLLTAA